MSQELGAAGVPTVPNPANPPSQVREDRDRIPMSLPVQKLAAPEIPGFHCHWMRSAPARLQQALRAGYTFVEQDEVGMNTTGLADDPASSGHTDLGSRVSIIAGTAEGGGAERLYLMKLPQHLWEKDQAALGQRNESVAAQLRGSTGFSEAGQDASHRYAGHKSNENRNLFIPKRRS